MERYGSLTPLIATFDCLLTTCHPYPASLMTSKKKYVIMKWIISECHQLDSLGLDAEELRIFREVL